MMGSTDPDARQARPSRHGHRPRSLVCGLALLTAVASSAGEAAPPELEPADAVDCPRNSLLRVPMPDGVSAFISSGLNNARRSDHGGRPQGSFYARPHQLYGLDFQPVAGASTAADSVFDDVVAPVSGNILWKTGDALGLSFTSEGRLMSVSLAHFADAGTFAAIGTDHGGVEVCGEFLGRWHYHAGEAIRTGFAQGETIGDRSSGWIHLSLEWFRSNGRRTPIPFMAGYRVGGHLFTGDYSLEDTPFPPHHDLSGLGAEHNYYFDRIAATLHAHCSMGEPPPATPESEIPPGAWLARIYTLNRVSGRFNDRSAPSFYRVYLTDPDEPVKLDFDGSTRAWEQEDWPPRTLVLFDEENDTDRTVFRTWMRGRFDFGETPRRHLFQVTHSRRVIVRLDRGTVEELSGGTGNVPRTRTHELELAGMHEIDVLYELPEIGPGAKNRGRLQLSWSPDPGGVVEVVELTADPASGTFPLTTELAWEVSYSGNGAVRCVLDPGDGSPPYTFDDCEGASSQLHTYLQPAVYTAELRAEAGSSSDVATVTIQESQALWPLRLHDASASGFNPLESELVPPLTLAYRIDPPAGHSLPELLAPVASADRVLVLAAKDDGTETAVEARDLAAGARLWETTVPGFPLYSQPAVAGELFYVAIDRDWNEPPDPSLPVETIYALSTGTGDRLWSRELRREPGADEAGLQVVVDEAGLYALFALASHPNRRVGVRAYDPLSGELLWDVDHPWEGFGHPGVVGNTLTFYNEASVVGLDKRTGELLWEVGHWEPDRFLTTWSWDLAASAAEGLIYVPWHESFSPPPTDGMEVLDAATGQVVWSFEAYGNGLGSTNPVVAGGDLYQIAGWFPTELLRFDAATGALRSRVEIPTPDGDYTFMSLANGVLFATTNQLSGEPWVRAFDATNGAVLWEAEIEDYSTAPLVAAGGRLLVTNHAGVAAYRSIEE